VRGYGDGNPVLATTSASDDAAQYIRAMIFSGELGHGERLPPGIELARRLGISVVTLRVALKSLETAGYIVTSLGAHGGSRVNDAEGLSACWIRWMAENADQIDDIFELRATIETRIAWLASERRSNEDLVAIETANELLAGPNPSVVPWNVAFHDAVAQAAHNRHLTKAMISVQGELFLPVDITKYEHRVVELRAAHEAILDGIRDQDPSAAAEAMRAHLADTLAAFKHSLSKTRRTRRRSTSTAGA
jgi:GntR family transcriptional repressor for pyruvate dehydrogenase complex